MSMLQGAVHVLPEILRSLGFIDVTGFDEPGYGRIGLMPDKDRLKWADNQGVIAVFTADGHAWIIPNRQIDRKEPPKFFLLLRMFGIAFDDKTLHVPFSNEGGREDGLLKGVWKFV